MSNQDKHLGIAQMGHGDDAWVRVDNVTVAFFSRYDDWAFTNARNLARELNSNYAMRLRMYDSAVKAKEDKLKEK